MDQISEIMEKIITNYVESFVLCASHVSEKVLIMIVPAFIANQWVQQSTGYTMI